MAGSFSIYQGPVPEWTKLVQTTGFENPDVSGLTPLQLRAKTNTGRVEAARAIIKAHNLKDQVTWDDHSILTRDCQNIVARIYRPRYLSINNTTLLPVYLYFHGGGHLFGNVDTEDASCCRIVASSKTPLIVVSVNYRHTPEFPHPTQIHDAWDSFVWLSSHISEHGGDRDNVVVGGVSAGGGLAAAVALQNLEARSSKLLEHATSGISIKGLVLCSPWLIHPEANPLNSKTLSSFEQNQDAPILPWNQFSRYAALLGPEAKTDPYFNVGITATDKLIGFPKTSFLIAGQDLLRDEGFYFAEKLKHNGTPTKVHVFPGLPHGFRRFGQLESTVRWEKLIVESIGWCFSKDENFEFKVEQFDPKD